MTAAVADHKQDFDDSVGRGRTRHVQVDHHAARAVGIDPIGTPFLPCRCESGWNAVAYVIALCEVAVAVENFHTRDYLRRTIRKTCRGICGDAERVFALQRRVRAAEIVASSC